MPDYYLEYDMMVDSTVDLSYAYFSLMQGESLTFERNGINIDGNLLFSSENKGGKWKHVAVGLCSWAPISLSKFGLGFNFKAKAKATVYIDNLRIKNMKGEVIYELFIDELNKCNSWTR